MKIFEFEFPGLQLNSSYLWVSLSLSLVQTEGGSRVSLAYQQNGALSGLTQMHRHSSHSVS